MLNKRNRNIRVNTWAMFLATIWDFLRAHFDSFIFFAFWTSRMHASVVRLTHQWWYRARFVMELSQALCWSIPSLGNSVHVRKSSPAGSCRTAQTEVHSSSHMLRVKDMPQYFQEQGLPSPSGELCSSRGSCPSVLVEICPFKSCRAELLQSSCSHFASADCWVPVLVSTWSAFPHASPSTSATHVWWPKKAHAEVSLAFLLCLITVKML